MQPAVRRTALAPKFLLSLSFVRLSPPFAGRLALDDLALELGARVGGQRSGLGALELLEGEVPLADRWDEKASLLMRSTLRSPSLNTGS